MQQDRHVCLQMKVVNCLEFHSSIPISISASYIALMFNTEMKMNIDSELYQM